MILSIDTAGNEAFLGLYEEKWLATVRWESGRTLSAELLGKIEKLYHQAKKEIKQTSGIIVNAGPGSFTGLRIGLSVANALAYDLNIPIVGVEKGHQTDVLIERGIKFIDGKKTFSKPILPEYGAEPRITRAKK